MPIEIRELVIRATVEQNHEGDENRETAQRTGGNGAKQQWLDQMEELKKIIQEKNER